MKRSMGWSVRPLTRVGIYMTGGEAALPSSVVHSAVPAVVAGVKELVGFLSLIHISEPTRPY